MSSLPLNIHGLFPSPAAQFNLHKPTNHMKSTILRSLTLLAAALLSSCAGGSQCSNRHPHRRRYGRARRRHHWPPERQHRGRRSHRRCCRRSRRKCRGQQCGPATRHRRALRRLWPSLLPPLLTLAGIIFLLPPDLQPGPETVRAFCIHTAHISRRAGPGVESGPRCRRTFCTQFSSVTPCSSRRIPGLPCSTKASGQPMRSTGVRMPAS